MQYTDQEIEDGITALMDRGQNKASALRTVLNMMHANLASLVIPAGAKFKFGSGVPASALGSDGDVYDNILTGDRYSKEAGAWVFQYRAKGDNGYTPEKGKDYTDGYTPRKGVDYRDGTDGKSAYEVWLGAGNVGSVAVFLQSLRGSATATDGKDGTIYHQENYDPADTDGSDGDIWQTSVSLTTERRFKKVAGAWRKFYDNTGTTVIVTPPNTAPSVLMQVGGTSAAPKFTATAADSDGIQSIFVKVFDSTGGAVQTFGPSAVGDTSYVTTWSSASAGNYTAKAIATDKLGLSTTSDAVAFTVSAAPAVPTLGAPNPTTGIVGSSVTLPGTNLAGATGYAFGGVAGPSNGISNNTATSITLVVPTGALPGFISVTTVGGSANSASVFSVSSSGVVDIALTIEGHSMAQYPNDYTEFQPPVVAKTNAGITANGRAGSISSVQNFAHSGDRLVGQMIDQYPTQVKTAYIAGKTNVLLLFWLTNELSNQVNASQVAGVASQATYDLAKGYINQALLDNPGWLIVSETVTPRTNDATPQPAFETERLALNTLLRNGLASGDFKVKALADIGADTRKLNPGPNVDGSPSKFYKDWVHPSAQSVEVIEAPYFRDAILKALFNITQPAPFTGTDISNLYLAGAQKLVIATQTGGYAETVTGSGIYQVTPTGTYADWTRDAVFNLKMPATGSSKVGFKMAGADALNAIIGLTATASLVSGSPVYQSYDVSFYRHEDGRIRYKEGAGSADYQIGSKVPDGAWPFFEKDGSQLKLVSTVDGQVYSDLVLFSGTYATDLTCHAALEASLGLLYAPQGFGLVAAGSGGGATTVTVVRANTAAFSDSWTKLDENGGDAFTQTFGTVGTIITPANCTRIRLFGQYGTGKGVLRLTVDNVRTATVDSGSASSGPNQLMYDFTNLPSSAHTFQVQKDADDGTYIVVNYFEFTVTA